MRPSFSWEEESVFIQPNSATAIHHPARIFAASHSRAPPQSPSPPDSAPLVPRESGWVQRISLESSAFDSGGIIAFDNILRLVFNGQAKVAGYNPRLCDDLLHHRPDVSATRGLGVSAEILVWRAPCCPHFQYNRLVTLVLLVFCLGGGAGFCDIDQQNSGAG